MGIPQFIDDFEHTTISPIDDHPVNPVHPCSFLQKWTGVAFASLLMKSCLAGCSMHDLLLRCILAAKLGSHSAFAENQDSIAKRKQLGQLT